mgnify:CR=1 FL=1
MYKKNWWKFKDKIGSWRERAGSGLEGVDNLGRVGFIYSQAKTIFRAF